MPVFRKSKQYIDNYGPGLSRMAKLDRSTLHFGSALLLGLAGGNLAPSASELYYNGRGFTGDLQAIGSDFDRSMARFDRSRIMR